jgi:hypothetical protein
MCFHLLFKVNNLKIFFLLKACVKKLDTVSTHEYCASSSKSRLGCFNDSLYILSFTSDSLGLAQ